MDDIIYTQQVKGHLDLLRQMLDKLSMAGLSVNFSKSSPDILSKRLWAWWWTG